MKKRVLSFLLLLAMLVTMVPAMAFGTSASETTEEEPPRSEVYTDVSDFYSLYKTEGLIAFFDAFDPANGTLDMENGKWYAKVYDEATGAFVKSETIFATLEGGAYDAETNPTGWKVGANGGFGYDDPEFVSSNKLSFDAAALLRGGVGALNAPWDFWTVETIVSVNLRTIPVEIRTFTSADDAEHKLTVATEGDDLGAFAAKTSVVTAKWGTTKQATIVLTGAAGTAAAVRTIVSGASVTPETKDHNVTIGDDGKATIKVDYKANYTDIAVFTPTGIAVESIACPINTAKNTASSNAAFLFGPLSGRHWTNTLGQDYSGGGAGTCRWSVSKTPGSYSPPRVMVVAPGGGDWSDSTSFINNNGKINSLVATKATNGDEITYTVTHGDHFRSGVTKKSDDFKDIGLHIMDKEQGMVYALRVYGTNDGAAALTTADSKWNVSVDTLLRLGVSVDVFNKMNDELKEEFLTLTLPNMGADATAELIEKAMEDAIKFEQDKENAKKLSVYDELYVGADGSRTANGGYLVHLFSAFNLDASVNLANGVWVDKLSDNTATFGNSKYWERRDDSAVGYTGFYGQLNADGTINKSASTNNISAGASSFTQTRLDLGLELLPKDDYTIEYVAKYMPIYVADANGDIALDADGGLMQYYNVTGNGVPSSQYAGAIDAIGFITSWSVSRDGTYSNQMPNRGDIIWMHHKDGKSAWGADYNWLGSAAWGSGGLRAPNIRETGAVHTYAMSRDEEQGVDPVTNGVAYEALYAIHRDASTYNNVKLSTAETAKGYEYFTTDDKGYFYLSSMLPTDFYSVRIYTAVLTPAEMQHNNFVDMAAYVGADLNDFLALDAATQSLVEGLMAGQGFPEDKESFAVALKNAVDLYKDPVTAEDTLYVQDGLRVLTTAYKNMHTGALAVGDSAISWFNAAKIGESINVKGKGWQLRADGGYYMIKDYTEFYNDRNFGIYLTPEMLPEADYTVQMVLNPTGIVDYNEDGTYTRHVDEQTTYGYNYEHGFSIGPLRCLIFPSAAVGGSRAGMEKRWCYNYGNRMWNGLDTAGRRQIMTENNWRFVGVNDIISYAISLDKDEMIDQQVYKIYTDNAITNTATLSISSGYTNEQANNMFQLMCYHPGGVFSVRVYDRVLTQAEMIQNQAVDVIYYYDLDTSLMNDVLKYFKGEEYKVFRGLAELGFGMDKEEAQRIFDARLSALWLSYADVGVRNDETDHIRFYFDLDEASATSMINAGFQVEIGAIVNVGQGALPTIDGRNYDYKVVAYDSVGGKNGGFFIDEDTFAVTVMAGSSNREALLKEILVRGYIRLISDDGTETVFYAETSNSELNPDSMFKVYDYMQKKLALSDEYDLLNYLADATDDCYVKQYVYLKADAAPGGDGSKDAPFRTFAEAFAESKKQLLTINVPTYLYLQADDGIYEMNEILSIDGSEIPYEFSRFIITSKNGNSTLTSNKVIDNNGFVETEGNIWAYQFEADENGNYPEFRYLYVNGEIASIAHNGAANINENDVLRYESPFYRFEDGPLMVAKEMYAAGTLTHDELYYPEEKVALRTRFAYYRDWFLAYQDVMALERAGELTYNSAPAMDCPTTQYATLFEDFRNNRVAVKEMDGIFMNEANMVSPKMLDILKSGKVTSYTDAPASYQAKFVEIRDILIKEMTSTPNYRQASLKLTIDLPTAFTASEAQEQRLSAFSSGVYAQVKALHDANKLTHESLPLASEAMLAQGQQFLYYRDAFLAIDAVNALVADIAAKNVEIKAANAKIEAENAANPDAEPKPLQPLLALSFDSQPLTDEGSELFKALFTQYLYEKLAADELSAEEARLKTLEHGAVNYKSNIGNYTTKYENAPAEYVAVFTTMRDEGMINFTYFTNLKLEVLEADGPYSGNIPLIDPRDENKVYFQKDLVGDQSFAIEQGFARLAADAEKLVADAYAAYLVTYEKFMATQKMHEDYVIAANVATEAYQTAMSEGKMSEAQAYKAEADKMNALASTYLSTVNNARNDCLAAYNAYKDAAETAAEYLADETDERYTLKDSGLEFKMVVEWNFNIVHMSGVDYDDKIVKGDTEYVALYMKESEYSGFVVHTESYFKSRMTTMQFSYSYLDKDNEYYYDAVTGTLYYCNEDGVDGLKFEYPTMQNMLYLSNISRMTIEKMAFTGLDDTVISKDGFTGGQASGDVHVNFLGEKDNFPSRAAIYAYMIHDLSIEGCEFHDLGCEGITTRMKAENFTIADNVFRNIGSSAIRVGGSTSSQVAFSQVDGAENVLITNNYLDGIALYLFTSPAIYMQYAKDIQMTYNTIWNTSYTGISIGWSWSATSFMYGEGVKLMHCEIAYNFCTNFMMELGDGGALYTLGGNASKDEHRLFNWAHDNYWLCQNMTGDGEKHFFAANYHDGSSTNWETYNTVVVAHSYGSAWTGDVYGSPEDEEIDDEFFDNLTHGADDLDKEEYQRRIRNRRNSIYYFYEQTVAGADSYNITLHDNYLINSRCIIREGMNKGSQHYEAYRGRARESFFIYVENQRYVKNPGNIPGGAEDIMLEAGCDLFDGIYKGDPSVIADNNY